MSEPTPHLDDLRALIARHAGQPAGAIDGLLLSSVDRPTEPTSSITDPVLAVVAQGAKRLTLGDRIYDYGAGQYLVVSVGLPVSGHFTRASPQKPFLGVGLALRPAAIASLLLETGSTPRTAAGGGSAARTTRPGLGVSDAPAELIDALARMIRLFEHPADLPVLSPLIEKEILWRLITGEQGALVRQIGLADSRLAHIGRAIRWIREHYAQSLRVEDLARLSAMSVSPFHRHFRAVTAMTPIQFQKLIRLQEARLLLMSGTDEVAAVGFAVGYDSASQFSREYRRQFGVPPGRDAARLRQEAARPDRADGRVGAAVAPL
ncbi:AraC family transcriptional regulator [Streptomyces sulfonofaciens]|uniref:AraC family transcriptional regulator n=1 Tax=Streptomyces sulfonofaciens TaxID=68272 RepID=A0A919GJD7_9ACTN|nr:AraC family transcriptional regulator [Streptomyces sulfonofaciens]GHH85113.1 AraC family transcriptional regulator [Streptomyces sulfonofaciens]